MAQPQVMFFFGTTQESKEREAQAAEGGWTVVTHHKGRKKTTDVESGITVGSVAQAAVEEKMAKKKEKGVGLNFYRFQRKEAQRNGMMSLLCTLFICNLIQPYFAKMLKHIFEN